jgi:hypothetical protein
MEKRNKKFIAGLFAGLLAPPIGFIIFCLLYFSDETVLSVWQRYERIKVLPHIISLSLLINLALFFLFIRLKIDESARGVLIATFIFGLMVIALKFF